MATMFSFLARLGLDKARARIAVAGGLAMLILLFPLAGVWAQITLSGRQTWAGRVTLGTPASAPLTPGIAFSDFHYSDNFPSNTTTISRITNGPTFSLQFDFTGLVKTTNFTGNIYFIVEGSSLLLTNWSGYIQPEWGVAGGRRSMADWPGHIFSFEFKAMVQCNHYYRTNRLGWIKSGGFCL